MIDAKKEYDNNLQIEPMNLKVARILIIKENI